MTDNPQFSLTVMDNDSRLIERVLTDDLLEATESFDIARIAYPTATVTLFDKYADRYADCWFSTLELAEDCAVLAHPRIGMPVTILHRDSKTFGVVASYDGKIVQPYVTVTANGRTDEGLTVERFSKRKDGQFWEVGRDIGRGSRLVLGYAETR